MSTTVQTESNPPPSAASKASLTTLFLSVGLAVSTTAAIIFGVLYCQQSGRGGNPIAAALDESLPQKGTVSPRQRFTDIVYYETPYASPPNLILSAPKRQYDIVSQDEVSFTWMARPMLEDFPDDTLKGLPELSRNPTMDKVLAVGNNLMKPNLQYEDFTWEARGVRASKGAPVMRSITQTGKFMAVAEEHGEEGFEFPFATAPNIELSKPFTVHDVVIVECRPTGFKWKVEKARGGVNGTVVWKAKGIRATEIPKEIPKVKPD